MTDIRLPLGGLKFSVRVAILCVRNGKVLVNTGVGDRGPGFWFLPGGALATGEDAQSCAQREWTEETGTLPGPLHLAGIVEPFFGPPHRRQHELGFYFRMDAPPELPDEPFTVLDDADTLCEWIPMDEIESRPVYPLIIRGLLEADDATVRHIVNRE
ncbi:NUDIX domain-containing protein [Deinococcus aerophilus]|uniref:DNA mismatch repair protein MutT n=1 Tax=Deinococcus aerophilus TaxID=522488 RepID=A0ABQ2GRP8_9DEIO|nr:NUDIX domain-containing protein [Deinococcus aerophilus]GGM08763.1 DNA mismatch repair protein MutT [Deinococcus aerophilus]